MLRSVCLLGMSIALITGQAFGQVPDTMTGAEWFRPSAMLHRALIKPTDFPGIRDPNTTLGKAIECLSNRYELRLLVNSRAFNKVGIEDVLTVMICQKPIGRMQNANLHSVLPVILARIPSRSRATFVVSSEWIEITTRCHILEEYLPELLQHGFGELANLRRGSFSIREAVNVLIEAINLKQALVDKIFDADG